ncbi:MAG: hypothetical protein WD739_01275 [Actinomycetota bacterium]
MDKERLIEIKGVTMPDGQVQKVQIYATDGAAAIGRLNDEGEMILVPLERVRTQRRASKSGYSWNNQYRLPAEFGHREITFRLQGNDADAAKKLNRAENLRAIPRSDPDFGRLYVRRSDAESINRHLEDTLYLNRAHSVGMLRQEADLLGFALSVKAMTVHDIGPVSPCPRLHNLPALRVPSVRRCSK